MANNNNNNNNDVVKNEKPEDVKHETTATRRCPRLFDIAIVSKGGRRGPKWFIRKIHADNKVNGRHARVTARATARTGKLKLAV